MNNTQRLGNILDGRMKRTSSSAIPTAVELGTINNNMSLSTDSLKSPIPKGDYMVDARLRCSTYDTSNDEGHTHELPDNFRALSAGDRVLVNWCGNEPIVVAIVVSS